MEAGRGTACSRGLELVWTPDQLSAFLSRVAGHPLFPVFRLIGMRGLRRGEACGLQWADLDLDDGVVYISRQLQQDAVGRLRECTLKTESSRRAVALDSEMVTVLRAHRSRQRTRYGEAAIASRRWVFTREDGSPLPPEFLTGAFTALAGETGLLPVRLHDLRHGAATLMLLAGMELKTIADQLGHSSVVLTADILAGAPELLSRYRNAPPVAAALVNAAMDARRLGMAVDLPSGSWTGNVRCA